MKKLNQRKIRWICREVKKGEFSICKIARIQKVTPRHVRRVYEKYRGVKRPCLLPCGRRPKPFSEEEIGVVLTLREEHPICAVYLEKILDDMGYHIPHNRIHKILCAHGMARPEPRKQKRRKPWIRYERDHSNSLWHADWFERDGEKIVLFEDDASRLLTGFGSYQNATAENAKKTLEEAINHFGKPEQLITDHGVQFTSIPRETCPEPRPNEFQRFLKDNEIQHIKARVKHPQTLLRLRSIQRALLCKQGGEALSDTLPTERSFRKLGSRCHILQLQPASCQP